MPSAPISRACFKPTRNARAWGRQGATRVYANDTVTVVNWVKIDGKWLTVDFHISRVPAD